MEQTPKYKLGQKVWFVTENNKLCYGIITLITPVNYTLNYNIKMTLDSVGEVTKNTIWEHDILGDFNDDYTEICYKSVAAGIAHDIDERIIKSMIAEKKIEVKEPNYKTWKESVKEHLEHFSNKYTSYKMGTVEPLYVFDLERDFSTKCDLAFILGAIKKYGASTGCHADLAGYIMHMAFQMIEDMRKNVNKEQKESN